MNKKIIMMFAICMVFVGCDYIEPCKEWTLFDCQCNLTSGWIISEEIIFEYSDNGKCNCCNTYTELNEQDYYDQYKKCFGGKVKITENICD